MALYSPFTTPPQQKTTYGDPQGQSTQNALLRSLSMNVAPPQTAPANTGFGTYNQSGDTTPAGQVQQPAMLNTAQNTSNQLGETAASANTNTGNGGLANLDFSGDPILAQIRAMNASNIANAEASALAARKRAEIGYGYDPNLKYEDPATQAAAQQNPFSTLAQLLQLHTQREGNLTESLNKANLFYSGERIRQTGLEGRQSLLEQSQAQGALQNVIGQIAQSILNARMNAQQAELGGESAAYDRAIQFALANNTGFPGGSGGGGGSSTTRPATSEGGYATGGSGAHYYNGDFYNPGSYIAPDGAHITVDGNGNVTVSAPPGTGYSKPL